MNLGRKRRHPRTTGPAFSSTRQGRFTLHLLRILTSAVFIFSGIVKAVDPLGTVYKIEDYLQAFGVDWIQVSVVAYPAAFLLIALELMIGIQLLFMVRFRLSTLLAFLFMVVMTPLTLYIALYNPVTDCGCFGDAITISNWQTFAKNMVLLAITLVLLLSRAKFKTFFVPRVENVIALVFLVIAGAFMAYNLMHLPMLDFRPYKKGVDIKAAMKIPEGAPIDEYTYSFTYRKDGRQKRFGLNDLPDSTWTFVEQHSELIRKGYEPEIKSFTILDANFQDIGGDILDFNGTSYLVLMYDLTRTSDRGIARINDLYASRADSRGRFFGITASSSEVVAEFKKQHKLTFPIYSADPVFLKTIIRANPGVVVITNGTIVDKRNWRDIDNLK